MAETHTKEEKRTTQPLVTAYFIGLILLFGAVALFTNPHSNWANYEPEQQHILAATHLPAPLAFGGKEWVPVDDIQRDMSKVQPSGAVASGHQVFVDQNADPAKADVIYLRDKQKGDLQPYVTMEKYLGPKSGSGVRAAETESSQQNLEMPAAFRYDGYTWHQNSHAVQKNTTGTPTQRVATVLGRGVYADVPGPEAHRNNLYVEIRPGSEVVQPYVPVEALYSTSDQPAPGEYGLGGKPNPVPVVDSPNLPQGPVQDPRNSGTLYVPDQQQGGRAVPLVGLPEQKQDAASGKPNIGPTPATDGQPNAKVHGGRP